MDPVISDSCPPPGSKTFTLDGMNRPLSVATNVYKSRGVFTSTGGTRIVLDEHSLSVSHNVPISINLNARRKA